MKETEKLVGLFSDKPIQTITVKNTSHGEQDFREVLFVMFRDGSRLDWSSRHSLKNKDSTLCSNGASIVYHCVFLVYLLKLKQRLCAFLSGVKDIQKIV